MINLLDIAFIQYYSIIGVIAVVICHIKMHFDSQDYSRNEAIGGTILALFFWPVFLVLAPIIWLSKIDFFSKQFYKSRK